MSTKLQFSPVEDEKLIADISNYPVLYDSRDKNYKNNGAKGLVWDKVSVKVNRTGKVLFNYIYFYIYLFYNYMYI